MLIVACARVHACLLAVPCSVITWKRFIEARPKNRPRWHAHAPLHYQPITRLYWLRRPCMHGRQTRNVNAAPDLPAGQGRRERLEPS